MLLQTECAANKALSIHSSISSNRDMSQEKECVEELEGESSFVTVNCILSHCSGMRAEILDVVRSTQATNGC